MVDISLGEVGVEVWAFNEAKEKLVNDLKMRPCKLEDGFVFLGVECIAGGVDRRGYGTKEIGRKL